MSKWIGVDLDGTLAKYDRRVSIETIGDPIPSMVRRIKSWIDRGVPVKIFTARVARDQSGKTVEEISSII